MERAKKILLKNELDTFFANALKEGVFSGASVGVQKKKGLENNFIFTACYGHTDCLDTSFEVHKTTFFDLASLTKPLVTVLLLLTLLEKGTVRLDDRLSDLLPSCDVPSDKKDIRLWQLMSHCAGFAAHRPYYRELLGISRVGRMEYLISSILQENLEYKPSEKHIYSDLGYLLLGCIIERQTERPLADSFTDSVLRPLGLENTLMFPKAAQLDMSSCAATEICPWTKTKLCGTVHDDNCRLLGGAAGHAGLFGTVEGVLSLCGYLCRVWHADVKKTAISADLLRNITKRVGKSTWTYGFDTPTKLYSSSGKYFSSTTIGHLGFTGTSFWIDLEREIIIVFLTNRVCPSRKNEKIKRIRPKLHDLIMKKLV